MKVKQERVIAAVVIVVILVLAGVAGIAAYYKTAPAAESNVFATLQANSDYSTLVGALQTAGLSEILSGSAPYTIFAPTNQAFSNMPSGALSALLSNPTKLTSVLNYHIVAGKINESSMFELTSLTTLQGSALPIGVAGPSLEVGGNASLTLPQIPCTNGVIHPISTVLVPPVLVSSTLGSMTILQTAESLGLTYFVQGLQTSNIASTLASPGNYTVFAPSNNAMSAFTCTDPYANCLSNLMANGSALAEVMQDNIISGNFTVAQLVKLGSVTTTEGQVLTVVTCAATFVSCPTAATTTSSTTTQASTSTSTSFATTTDSSSATSISSSTTTTTATTSSSTTTTTTIGTVNVGIATIIQTNIKCTNGYLDITDAVLVPPGY